MNSLCFITRFVVYISFVMNKFWLIDWLIFWLIDSVSRFCGYVKIATYYSVLGTGNVVGW